MYDDKNSLSDIYEIHYNVTHIVYKYIQVHDSVSRIFVKVTLLFLSALKFLEKFKIAQTCAFNRMTASFKNWRSRGHFCFFGPSICIGFTKANYQY